MALLDMKIHFKCMNFTNLNRYRQTFYVNENNVSGTEGTAGSVTGWDVANADTRSPAFKYFFEWNTKQMVRKDMGKNTFSQND